MFTRRHLVLTAGVAPLANLVHAPGVFADSAPPPKPYAIEDFFGDVETYDTALSPNGKLISLAGLVKAPEPKAGEKTSEDKNVPVVLVLDATDPSKVLHKFNASGHRIQYTMWAKDNRLLVWIVVLYFDGYPIRRIVAIDPDGSNPVTLFENKRTSLNGFVDLGGAIDFLSDHPTDILMMAWDPNKEEPALYRVNVMTGSADRVEVGSLHTVLWAVQDGVAMLRIDVNDRGDVMTVLARPPGETSWKVARKFRADQTPDFFIVGPTAKAGVFLVGARLEGEDTVSVRELDIATMIFSKPVSSRPGSDSTGGFIDQYKRFVATAYTNDRTDYDFVDPALAPHYRGINSYFDHACNVRITEVDRAFSRLLLTVTGPQEPGSYYLYDRAQTKVLHLGTSRPDLDPDRLASMEAISIKTRDGGKISAYLSAPVDRKPGPLVVMPHGGPEIRDSMGFDIWVQVLAAQGWWVLQPNFRGSGGYGLDFAKAGWRHWDGRMQEDLDDAIDQALALRKLDAKRVAIMGASYGGYAALMGGLRRPDLYKAAISIAGPADLTEMLRYERQHDDTPDHERYGFWSSRIGDLDKGEAALDAASPRKRAKEFKVPVFLIHGDADKIVPVSQSREMNRALKEAGASVDYLEVKGVGHPSWPDKEEMNMLHRSVSFLTKAFA
ncbi:MAG TPA: alpha/beta fold hydrolase [Caulobacteraceae bacterium]|jgi:dipeptidyl aminopeptidase/acylaminoacyl peptidase|nr:alpha/beta fold hydrolase [Caulobacteraceae bacterium]